MQKSRRLLELDVFRGIAALFVVLFHYTTRYEQIYGHKSELLFHVDLGHYGVKLFFIISGFVIFLTLKKTKHPLDFIISRISRLYPVYWAAIITTFVAISLFALPGRETSIRNAIINASMLQSWFNIPSVDGVYWTLAVELKFYFLMLVCYLFKLLKRINILLFLWLAIVIVDQTLLITCQYQLPGPIRTILIFEHAYLFISGIVFYQLKNKRNDILLNLLNIGCLFVAWFAGNTESFIIISVCFILFYLFIFDLIKFIAVKPLLFFGTISYPLYLVHQNIGYIILNLGYKANINSHMNILITIIVVIGIATTLNYMVEKPLMVKIRNIYYKSRNKIIH